MKYLKKIILITCILGMYINIAACGRYSDPYPVEKSSYPHHYPHTKGGANDR